MTNRMQYARYLVIGLLVLPWSWGLFAWAAESNDVSSRLKAVRAAARRGQTGKTLARLDALLADLPAEDRTFAWTYGVGKWLGPT